MTINIGNSQLKLLERLCNAVAVSGEEGEVRAIVLEELKGRADEVKVDALGNVLATRPGEGSGKGRLRVMRAAHMDEVGFMIMGADSGGGLRFRPIGGVDDRVLPGKVLLVGPDKIPGVIGAKPVHLLKGSEGDQVVKMDSMVIDIGAGSKDEAEKLVKPGQVATFEDYPQDLGPPHEGCRITFSGGDGPRDSGRTHPLHD